MPTIALDEETVVPKRVPLTFAVLLSDRWWMRVVKFPTVISSPKASTRVRWAPFAWKLS